MSYISIEILQDVLKMPSWFVFVDRLHILEDSDTKLLIVATEAIYEKTKGYVGEPLTTIVVHSHR